MKTATEWAASIGPQIQSEDDPNIDLLLPQLRPYVMEMPVMGIWIKHPWLNSPAMVGMANQTYERKFSAARQYLQERDLKAYLTVIVEPPWALSTIENWWVRDHITQAELHDLWTYSWDFVEFPTHGLHDPVAVWQAAGFFTDDEKRWEKLPNEITVYRGGDDMGLSWTTEIKVAEFFQRRYHDGAGRVFQSTIMKRDVLAYLTDRSESEIVADPYTLGDIECLS